MSDDVTLTPLQSAFMDAVMERSRTPEGRATHPGLLVLQELAAVSYLGHDPGLRTGILGDSSDPAGHALLVRVNTAP